MLKTFLSCYIVRNKLKEKKLHRNAGNSINVKLYKSDNINIWLELALSLGIVPASITRVRKMEDRLQFISHIYDEVISKHNICVFHVDMKLKLDITTCYWSSELRWKQYGFFSRYEHVYLCNAIHRYSGCGWIFTRLLYSRALNVIYSSSEFQCLHHYIKKSNSKFTPPAPKSCNCMSIRKCKTTCILVGKCLLRNFFFRLESSCE